MRPWTDGSMMFWYRDRNGTPDARIPLRYGVRRPSHEYEVVVYRRWRHAAPCLWSINQATTECAELYYRTWLAKQKESDQLSLFNDTDARRMLYYGPRHGSFRASSKYCGVTLTCGDVPAFELQKRDRQACDRHSASWFAERDEKSAAHRHLPFPWPEPTKISTVWLRNHGRCACQ
jgi:hypothetical protein